MSSTSSRSQRRSCPPAHSGYLATGTDDDATIRANREGYAHWDLRVRRLVDFRKLDASAQIHGATWPTPIVINPLGSQRAFHPEGELAVARAAKAKNHLMVLSTVATTSIEDVIAARGAPVWFQLYHQQDWNLTKQMVKRAERAGAPAVVFTVDLIAGTNRVPIILDGGIRRGTDVFKPLALGATATGIGRAYIWGLASFGQEGVETVLALLRKETEIVMRQAGTPSVKAITRAHIVRHGT